MSGLIISQRKASEDEKYSFTPNFTFLLLKKKTDKQHLKLMTLTPLQEAGTKPSVSHSHHPASRWWCTVGRSKAARKDNLCILHMMMKSCVPCTRGRVPQEGADLCITHRYLCCWPLPAATVWKFNGSGQQQDTAQARGTDCRACSHSTCFLACLEGIPVADF